MFLFLNPADTNKTIYELEYLLHLKIEFEAPSQKGLFLNTPDASAMNRQKFSNYSLRYVKFTNDHATKHWPRKEKLANVKSILYI